MADRSALSPRRLEILHAIVQSFIQTGEPVASRTISKTRPDHLSPASVRNVMADLFDEGYLAQPHTSAGRVPTEKAFRSYVESLNYEHLLVSELERMRKELSNAGSLEERVERSSHMLSEMTLGFCIAAAIPASMQILDQIQLVPLTDNRVLMVVVTRDHMVRNRVVILDHPLSGEELESIRNYVNHNFGGWMLVAARLEMQRRLTEERALYDEILKKLTVLYAKGLLDVELGPEIHVDGASNLVSGDLRLTQERTRELFRALEEKTRILQLLDRFLEQGPGELAVRVGLGEAHPAMRDLSFVGTSVTLAGGISAKIAVIGPMRMNYSKAISAVKHMGEAFQTLPT
jgi:heat-inducible transcriptional repressor